MTKPVFIAFLFLLGLAVAMPEVRLVGNIVGIQEAHAQKRKRKTLFDVLFKRRKKTTNTSTRKRPAVNLPGVRLTTRRNDRDARRVKRSTRSNPAPSTASAPKPQVVVVKNENAAKILVVGDFIASAVAKGLERKYSDIANLAIVNRSKANSGIVRDDVIDWANVVPTMIEEEKPIAVIALIGMNDRQQMRISSGRVEKLSEPWVAEYKSRITKIVAAGTSAKIPVLWIGLPPVKSSRMNTDYLAFNEMSRTITETAGAIFVDVWDGFTNAEGKFVSAGPDINGRIVRLRGGKGINMTRAGQLKLAFFADKALRKLGLVGNPEGFEYANLGTINPNMAQPSVPQYNPAESGKTVVLSLGSPSLDGGDALEGEADFLKDDNSQESVSFNLVDKGELRLPKPGRIDAQWGTPSEPAPLESEKEASAESDAQVSSDNTPDDKAPEAAVAN